MKAKAKKTDESNVRFQSLGEVTMKITVSWEVMPFSLLDVYRHFGATCCIHLQGEE
jgi:hypothetical protein